MNLKDLIETISQQEKISKAKTKRVIGKLITQINTSLSSGESFRLPGLGVFKTSFRNERVCRNPQNGESINVPARNAPKLSFARNVKRGVASAGIEQPLVTN